MTSTAISEPAVGAPRAALRRARIVIIGGGYGGAYCAQALGRALRGRDADILLLDRNNYFVFYPLLVEAGTGSLEPRHTVVEIRAFLGRRARFKMAEVLDVDPVERKVSYRLRGIDAVETVSYDHLVLAPGSVTRVPPVPGLERYGWFVKSLVDAVALRDRAIQLLEAAEGTRDERLRRALLHLVVVGGSFTGAEVAGEFQVFMRRATRHYPGLDPDDVRVTLIEKGDRILPALGDEMSAYAARKLGERGVSVRLRTEVDRVEREGALLGDGEWLDARTVVWCAGIAPSPLALAIDVPRDEAGWIECDDRLRVRGHDDVWAIGDAARNPDPEGQPYPATAQHAVRQAAHLATSIARVLSGREPERFVFRSRGVLAALGCRTGVARVFGVRLSGFPAWFLWRTVYLMKMPGLARRVRIALDWTLDLFFPAESVQLGVHRRAPPS